MLYVIVTRCMPLTTRTSPACPDAKSAAFSTRPDSGCPAAKH